MDFQLYESLSPSIFLKVERKGKRDWSYDKRQSGFHELYFMIGGKAAFDVNGETFIAHAGDIVYIPGGSVREAHTFADSPIHTFALNFHWLNGNHVALPFEIVMKDKLNDEILSYVKELHRSEDCFHQFKERGLFMLILNQLFRAHYDKTKSHMDPRIKKIVEYMSANYMENLDIEMMARMLSLHSVYLGKLFKQHTGMTFRAYLNRIRLNNAEQFLAAGAFSVSEVAVKCGFSDIYYFSKLFKLTKGYAPSSVLRKNNL